VWKARQQSSKELPMRAPGFFDDCTLDARTREAFDEAWRAISTKHVNGPLLDRRLEERERSLWLAGFAAHYRRLSALPRRTRRSIERRWRRTLSVIALLMTLGPIPAWAANIVVSPNTPPSIKADGKCSLIEAIVNANKDVRTHLECVAGSGADTILLPANSQQTLNGQELLPQITSRIVIEGHGSTIKRNTTTNLTFFSVSAAGKLTLNESTVTGATTGVTSRGYGAVNAGRLALNDSTITDTGGLVNNGGVVVLDKSRVTGSRPRGYDYEGCGIQNRSGGTLFVANSVISDNGAIFGGGGIRNDFGSKATLTDSVVSGNYITYEGPGGGILNNGTLVVVGTTISDNSAYDGGGIANVGTATIRRSTISGNRLITVYEYLWGGGIDNAGTLTLVNSTVSDNEAGAYGGGVRSGNNGSLTILSSTITGNRLTADPSLYTQRGGGVFVHSGTLTLERSIVSGNTATKTREIGVASGVVVHANDYNLFGHDNDSGIAGFAPGSTDIVPSKSLGRILLPLADNGGDTDTLTHALAIGSPALDASPHDANCPTIDQRGAPRPRGPACDIGSFEGSAVMCNGKVTTMVGTEGPEELTGTPGPDVIAGLNGDDAIGGLGGNDVVCAGDGADNVFGGDGNDKIFGQGGNDQLFGGDGTDSLDGGTGQDQCFGGPGTGDTAIACETVTGVP
jgi:hypothetical protein